MQAPSPNGPVIRMTPIPGNGAAAFYHGSHPANVAVAPQPGWTRPAPALRRYGRCSWRPVRWPTSRNGARSATGLPGSMRCGTQGGARAAKSAWQAMQPLDQMRLEPTYARRVTFPGRNSDPHPAGLTSHNAVRSESTCIALADFDLQRRVADLVGLLQHPAALHQEVVARMPVRHH